MSRYYYGWFTCKPVCDFCKHIVRNNNTTTNNNNYTYRLDFGLQL